MERQSLLQFIGFN